jgi:hypothetical protein
MTLNLSRAPFRGGQFLLRDRQSKRMLAEVANTGLGDALTFRISHELQHRIFDLQGDEPKIAFAGWFDQEGPELFEEIISNLRKSQGSQTDTR